MDLKIMALEKDNREIEESLLKQKIEQKKMILLMEEFYSSKEKVEKIMNQNKQYNKENNDLLR